MDDVLDGVGSDHILGSQAFHEPDSDSPHVLAEHLPEKGALGRKEEGGTHKGQRMHGPGCAGISSSPEDVVQDPEDERWHRAGGTASDCLLWTATH
jgi:hypothetical protein